MSTKKQNPRLANGGSGNLDNSGRTIEPVYSRPDDEKQVHRECYAWMERVCEDHSLTFGQRVVGVRVMLHLDRYSGRCDPSIKGLAERLGMSENSVRTGLQAIKSRGLLDYPENKGGKGHRHQFEFLVTPNQSGGLSKPSSIVEGSGTKTSTTNANPQAQRPNPPNSAVPNPPNYEPKPLSTVGGNSLNSKSNSSLNSNVPLPSVADTLPCRSESKVEEAKEERKRTSEGSKPEARATLERIENGVAYVKVLDHEARLEVIAKYGILLNQIRAAYPDAKVDKISAYVGRPKINGFGGHAS